MISPLSYTNVLFYSMLQSPSLPSSEVLPIAIAATSALLEKKEDDFKIIYHFQTVSSETALSMSSRSSVAVDFNPSMLISEVKIHVESIRYGIGGQM